MADTGLTVEEFDRACSLLPESTCWGERITPEIVMHIEQASRRAALEECWEAVHAEHLIEPTSEPDDVAYENAVADCERAIRALSKGETE